MRKQLLGGAVRVTPLKHCKNYWLFIKRRVGGTAPRDVLSPFGIQSQSHFFPTVALTLRGPLIKCTYVGNTVTHTHREIYVPWTGPESVQGRH